MADQTNAQLALEVASRIHQGLDGYVSTVRILDTAQSFYKWLQAREG